MRQESDKEKLSRRAFLRGSVTTGVGVAIAASVPAVAASSISTATDDIKRSEGYRLTQHIIDYYNSTAS